MQKALYLGAAACQFLTIFPFLIATEGIGFGEYVWWHYIVFYAVTAVFWVLGRVCTAWTQSEGFKKTFKPTAVFLSRIAVIVPIIGFVTVILINQLSTGLLLYMLPACIIMYFGGCRSYGRSYTDVFTTLWFGFYVVGAFLASLLISVSYEKSISSAGTFQLCVVFGILITVSAILTNQTNIDLTTRQRAAGKSVLPKGIRSYNAGIIACISVVIVGLCLFTEPIASAIISFIRFLIVSFINWLRSLSGGVLEPNTPQLGDNYGDEFPWYKDDSYLIEAFYVVLVIGITILIIRYRKSILAFLRELFDPLFKQNTDELLPFSDEIFETENARASKRSKKKTEQQLYRQYRRESDPVKRYRLGYLIFLIRLEKTPFAQKIYDTTDTHAVKGEMAFRTDEIRKVVDVYEQIRYGDRIPTEEECLLQQRLIEYIGK